MGDAASPYYLGSTNGVKRVHRSGCKHARLPYLWASQFATIEAMVDELHRTDAWTWHRFCDFCCADAVAFERVEYLGVE